MRKINEWADRLLSRPWVYLLFALFATRANDLKKVERALCGLSDYDPAECFPFLRVFLWVLCAGMLTLYLLRWFGGRIQKKQPMLLCFLAMHGMLILMTILYGGASGYWLHWVCALCLMLALDMGLQCEKKSVLEGFSLALLLYLTLNLPAMLIWPRGLNEAQSVLPQWYIDEIENVEALFAPEWVIGSRVFYYRLAFPALCLEMIRARCCDGRYTLRTLYTLALVTATVALQRGGTALMGYAALLAMLVVFNRRALPRWANPMTMTAFSVLLFVSLYYMRVQEHLGLLIEGGLGKDSSLTMRTEVWGKSLEIIVRHPFTGVGLLPVQYMRELFGSTFEQPLNHTHNQMLELLLHGGIPALACYLGMVWLATRETLAHGRSAAVKTAALLLMVFLFMGTVDVFHNEPIFYALFMLPAHAAALGDGGETLPRLSLFQRIRRDLSPRRKAA